MKKEAPVLLGFPGRMVGGGERLDVQVRGFHALSEEKRLQVKALIGKGIAQVACGISHSAAF